MINRILTYVLTLAVVFSTAACSGESGSADGKSMPRSSSYFEGKHFQDVVNDLQGAGFTNVETNALGDLITGWLHEDGEVKVVEVEGDSVFSTDDSFSTSTRIVVSYHSHPADADKTSQPSTPPESSATLTVENSEQLAALLAGPDIGDSVEAFSDQYRTKTIEFDGHVASIAAASVKKFKDVLILAGDSGKSPMTGPNFQITGDPTYARSNIPENISVGQNVRIMALVGEYNSQQGLFHLVPQSIVIK